MFEFQTNNVIFGSRFVMAAKDGSISMCDGTIPACGISPSTDACNYQAPVAPPNSFLNCYINRDEATIQISEDVPYGYYIISDDNGYGIPSCHLNAPARALESGNAGDIIRCLIVLGDGNFNSYDPSFDCSFS
jgi:hypothetical protein